MTIIPTPEPPKIEDIENSHPNGRLKLKGLLINGKEYGLWNEWYERKYGKEISQHMTFPSESEKNIIDQINDDLFKKK